MKRLIVLAFVLTCSTHFPQIDASADDKPIKVLIIGGQNNHDWRNQLPS